MPNNSSARKDEQEKKKKKDPKPCRSGFDRQAESSSSSQAADEAESIRISALSRQKSPSSLFPSYSSRQSRKESFFKWKSNGLFCLLSLSQLSSSAELK
jgi:hypothetical protein